MPLVEPGLQTPNPTNPVPRRLPAFVWPTLLLWLALLGVAAVYAPRLPGVTRQETSGVDGSDSQRASEIASAAFPAQRDTLLVAVFTSPGLPVDSDAYRTQVLESVRRLSELPEVGEITTYYDTQAADLLGRDGRSTAMLINVAESPGEVADRLVPTIRGALAEATTDHVQVYLTGSTAVAYDLNTSSEEALRRSELAGLPFIGLALLLIFGSVVAAGLPFLLGLASVGVTSAVVYFIALQIKVDNLAPSLISMLGLATGVDYSLFLVSRYREELAAGADRVTALTKTMRTSGKAIAFSGATVVVSIASLFIVKSDILRTLALAMTLVVTISAIAALTFLPAVLVLLGRGVDWLRLTPRRRQTDGDGFWHRWAMGVMRRPGRYLLLVLIPLLALSYPVLGMRTGWPFQEGIPAETESRRGAAVLAAQFEAGLSMPIEVVVRVAEGTVVSEKNLPLLVDLAARFRADLGVSRVLGVTSLEPGFTLADYRRIYLDAPQRLADMPSGLGEGASGVADAVDGLKQIEAGLRDMAGRLPALRSGLQQGSSGVAQLAQGLRDSVSGLAAVRTGLESSRAGVDQVAQAVGQLRGVLQQVRQNLEAMSPEAKADPQYAAAYQGVLTAQGILEGGGFAALDQSLAAISQGLAESAAGISQIEAGLNEAVSNLEPMPGQLNTSAGAVRETARAAQQMADGLAQIAPGLNELRQGLAEAASEAGQVNLKDALTAGDFPLRLVLSQAEPSFQSLMKELVNLDGGSNTAVFRVISKTGPDDEGTRQVIRRLRAIAAEVQQKDGLEIAVGGVPPFILDFNEELTRALPRVIALVLAITYVILMVLLGTPVLPLKAVLMNALSVAASYGLLTLVFQQGYGADWLGFEPLGYLEAPIILVLFAVLFGLSMDYEVFMLSRIKESYERTGDNETSVAQGLEQSAGIITGAAAIMIFVFSAFVFAGLISMKEFGFGLAVAVLLDATLIRIILVPAFMRLMGHWNWWAPPWMRRLLPGVKLDH